MSVVLLIGMLIILKFEVGGMLRVMVFVMVTLIVVHLFDLLD